jgi:hypothetical protein
MTEQSNQPAETARILLNSRSIVLDQQAQMRRFLDDYRLETHHLFSRLEEAVAVFADPETGYTPQCSSSAAGTGDLVWACVALHRAA